VRLAQRRPLPLLALPLALALITVACGDDSDTAAGGDDGGSGAASDGGELSGTIDVSGSSTVAPVTTRVAELFEEVAPEIQVNVDGPGTGDGFALFCDGETDISDASRPISAEELETCEANGVEFIELKIAIDGLSVLTNPASDIECLSFADMYALVGPESQGFGTWTDASDLAAELGSDTELPDAPLDVTAPGEESGTYDSFVEIVLEDIADERGQAAESRPDYQSSADDNVIIQGIEGSDSSFGWVGYAYAIEAGDAVKQLAVSEGPGGECITPTEETVADGSYPIARDLYIYPNVQRLEENPSLVELLDFYLSDEGLGAVGDVGYIDLDSAAIDETRQVWQARETGTRDGG
jgi:phosphate transport system substrate-binding protein